MTFAESVRINLGPKYLFYIKGRASRSEYWWFSLFATCGLSLLGLFFMINPVIGSVILLCGILGLFPPGFGVTVRRLHDINLSGWWFGAYILVNTLLSAIVLLGFLAGLAGFIAMVWPGNPGINRFGYPPIPDQAIDQ